MARHLGVPGTYAGSTGALPWEGLDEIARELRLQPGDALADIACGRGGYGIELARRCGARLFGVDFSAVALKHAETTAHRHLEEHRAGFAVGTLTATSLPSHGVNALLCTDSVQFAEPPAAALEEFRRVLVSGGRLALHHLANPTRPDPRTPPRISPHYVATRTPGVQGDHPGPPRPLAGDRVGAVRRGGGHPERRPRPGPGLDPARGPAVAGTVRQPAAHRRLRHRAVKQAQQLRSSSENTRSARSPSMACNRVSRRRRCACRASPLACSMRCSSASTADPAPDRSSALKSRPASRNPPKGPFRFSRDCRVLLNRCPRTFWSERPRPLSHVRAEGRKRLPACAPGHCARRSAPGASSRTSRPRPTPTRSVGCRRPGRHPEAMCGRTASYRKGRR